MTLVGCNYAAASVIARRRKGKIEFLVMDTVKLGGEDAAERLTQFPMEKAEREDNGNPHKTLQAGLEEETGLTIKPDGKAEILHFDQFGAHTKIFFLVWRSACRGHIRTRVIRDKRSILGVPYWADYAELERKLCRTHRVVLPKLRFLAVRPLAN